MKQYNRRWYLRSVPRICNAVLLGGVDLLLSSHGENYLRARVYPLWIIRTQERDWLIKATAVIPSAVVTKQPKGILKKKEAGQVYQVAAEALVQSGSTPTTSTKRLRRNSFDLPSTSKRKRLVKEDMPPSAHVLLDRGQPYKPS
jgi:hypothetical protein